MLVNKKASVIGRFGIPSVLHVPCYADQLFCRSAVVFIRSIRAFRDAHSSEIRLLMNIDQLPQTKPPVYGILQNIISEMYALLLKYFDYIVLSKVSLSHK